MLRNLPILASFLLILNFSALAQGSYTKQIITSGPVEIIDPRSATPDFDVRVINLEAPSPDGDSYRAFLMRQKIKSAAQFPRKEGESGNFKTNQNEPIPGRGIRKQRKLNNNTIDVVDGIPNDNTVAVSNGGIVLSGINSYLWAYDTRTDTTIFPQYIISLKEFGGGNVAANDFDPKLIYDEVADRFILVYLLNNTPSSSSIRVCFSSTNNPLDVWYRYTLPGNPLNNNRWTDFPSISLTHDELFITGNLIIPAVSWQVGFDGSVIWQLDKAAGFAGATQMQNTLWSDIKFNNRLIRNLHPVCGAESGSAATAFFLSNRNFDITNDTVFVLRLTGSQQDPNTDLVIQAVTTDIPYGLPPNGRQVDTNPNDPTTGLQTNDARVLGAITNGEWIQYVANTLNPANGFSGIYHGFVTDLFSNQPKVSGRIISHPTRDYGYPNIAYTGNEPCDMETIIGFNYTSPTDFAGIGVIYCANDSSYSNPVDIKQGENYTDRHAQAYERWGDYFGIQRKFNEPGTVWLSGYFGNTLRQNATWVAEVFSTDSLAIRYKVNQTGNVTLCSGGIEIQPLIGKAPFMYRFENQPVFGNSNVYSGICEEKMLYFEVQDSRGCIISDSVFLAKPIASSQPALFPNPGGSIIMTQFSLSDAQNLTVFVSDYRGNVVFLLRDYPAKSGLNELIFNTAPLANGTYILSIEGDKGFRYTEKFVKAN